MNALFDTQRTTVRRATNDDIPFIMELERHDDNRDYIFKGSFDDHDGELRDSNLILCIIMDNTQPIGFIISSFDSKNEVFELRRIAIQKKNQGYGYEVIKGLMKYAYEYLGVNRFWLDVFDSNERGIHLYEKLGMFQEGTRRHTIKTPDGYMSQRVYSILRDEYLNLKDL